MHYHYLALSFSAVVDWSKIIFEFDIIKVHLKFWFSYQKYTSNVYDFCVTLSKDYDLLKVSVNLENI